MWVVGTRSRLGWRDDCVDMASQVDASSTPTGSSGFALLLFLDNGRGDAADYNDNGDDDTASTAA